ncbi:ABC transporter permease [Lawsonibacter celer]|jgi:NitT/TauT family transport system permease protein|uniref:ABC transporter permease n=1 Tax=Lawsonibacter celer TaxID=2986526 RepID=UPI00164446E8|nr:ABC transporter permease [Lawsonibacter celer]
MKTKSRITSIVAPVVTFVLIFVAWEIACRVTGVPSWFVPKPSEIFHSMVVDFQVYLPHILVTLQCVLIGFLIAIPVGLIVSTLITSFPLLNAAMSPYITFLVTTPLISLIPLLMLAMGYGMSMRITVVVIQAFAVINMNACTGFNNVPTIRRELMQSVGASRLQTYWKMILPSAATDIITGLRLAAIFATTTCISVEYNAGNTGLGSQIIKYSQYMKTPESFACIFYVTIIGLIMYALISIIQKKIVNWQE